MRFFSTDFEEGQSCPNVGTSNGSPRKTGSNFVLCSKILPRLHMRLFARSSCGARHPKNERQKPACLREPSTTRPICLIRLVWPRCFRQHHYQRFLSRINVHCRHIFGKKLSIFMLSIPRFVPMKLRQSASSNSTASLPRPPSSFFCPPAPNHQRRSVATQVMWKSRMGKSADD